MEHRPISPFRAEETSPSVQDEAARPVGWLHRAAWLVQLFLAAVLFIAGQTLGMLLGAFLSGLNYAVANGGVQMSDAQLHSLVSEGITLGLDSATLQGQLAMCCGQLVALALLGLIWMRMRRRAFAPLRMRDWPPRDVARIAGALVAGGIGFQFAMSPVLTLLSQVFVQTFEEYGALMENAVGDAAIVEFVSVVVLAPVLEEIACRGVMLECGLRALLPWSRERGARGLDVEERAFWAANFLQALAFAVLHGNVVQSSYALVLGMAMGWVFWRTGKLRYAVLLHLSVNASSYLLGAFDASVGALLGPLAFLLVLALIGAGCLMAAWRVLKPLLSGAVDPIAL